MKYFLILIVFLCLAYPAHAHAHKRRYRELARTEVGLMNNVVTCLTNKDSIGYFYLFPPFDTLWRMVMHNQDNNPDAQRALNALKEHPQALLQFDPYYNPKIMSRFENVLLKGEDSGIHWNGLAMQRYELVKENPTRDLPGYDNISPERFKGYIFVRDVIGRLTFCITIMEIQKINGYFFGGQVINILEASSIDQYILKETQERKYFEWMEKHRNDDSVKTPVALKKAGDTSGGKNKNLQIVNTDDEKTQIRKQVIDRKYYEGKFDDEIPVKLYIRYLKDVKSGTLTFFEGLYRFGDQANYVKLDITKDADGKWLMNDDPPVGTMELELENKTYTGSWTNNENGTGYDAVLKQTVISEKKLVQLDNMLEKGIYGNADEPSIEKPLADTSAEGKSAKVERLEKKIQRQKEREKEREKQRKLDEKAEKDEQKENELPKEIPKMKVKDNTWE